MMVRVKSFFSYQKFVLFFKSVKFAQIFQILKEPVPKREIRAVNSDSHDDNRDSDDYYHTSRCAKNQTKHFVYSFSFKGKRKWMSESYQNYVRKSTVKMLMAEEKPCFGLFFEAIKAKEKQACCPRTMVQFWRYKKLNSTFYFASLFHQEESSIDGKR